MHYCLLLQILGRLLLSPVINAHDHYAVTLATALS